MHVGLCFTFRQHSVFLHHCEPGIIVINAVVTVWFFFLCHNLSYIVVSGDTHQGLKSGDILNNWGWLDSPNCGCNVVHAIS